MKDPTLVNIQTVMTSFGFESAWKSKTEETPFQYLTVVLPQDSKRRERNLIFKLEHQLEGENKKIIIQMIASLPFKLLEGTYWEVLRVINFFNNALSVPGLILNEGIGQVFFRYSFIPEGEEIKKELLFSLVRMILISLDAVSDAIEEAASGKSLNDIVESIAKRAEMLI